MADDDANKVAAALPPVPTGTSTATSSGAPPYGVPAADGATDIHVHGKDAAAPGVVSIPVALPVAVGSPPPVIVVTGVSPVGDPIKLSGAESRQVDSALETWRAASIALVVLGILGLIPTFSWVTDLLAIAAGCIGIYASKRDVLLAHMRGIPSGPAPVYGYFACIAMLVLVIINFIYCLALAIAHAPYAFNTPTTAGTRFLAVQYILGIFFAVAILIAGLLYLAVFDRLRGILGPRMTAGGCCDPLPPLAIAYVVTPHGGTAAVVVDDTYAPPAAPPAAGPAVAAQHPGTGSTAAAPHVTDVHAAHPPPAA